MKGSGNLSFRFAKGPKMADRRIVYGCDKVEKISRFCDSFVFKRVNIPKILNWVLRKGHHLSIEGTDEKGTFFAENGI